MYDVDRIFEDTQYQAGENIVSVADSDLGSVKTQGVPERFGTLGTVRHTGMRMDARNEEIVLHELGLSPDELGRLKARGMT